MQKTIRAFTCSASKETRALITEYSAGVREALGIDEERSALREHLYLEERDFPQLIFDDCSGIPLVHNVIGAEYYQLRGRVRAQTGDVFVGTHPLDQDYEAYNREFLNLGTPAYQEVKEAKKPFFLGEALIENSKMLDELISKLQHNQPLTIHPYMGIPEVWTLATKLASKLNCQISVLAPTPNVTAYANDKAQFSRAVSTLFGPEHIAETYYCHSKGELVTALERLSHTHSSIALKLANAASAMGNRLLSSKDFRQMERPYREQIVEKFLHSYEWDGKKEVLACAWLEDVSVSPSVQLWIPPVSTGEPIVEGVYEQQLIGEEKVFEGSLPATLSKKFQQNFADKGFALGLLFQALGYTGRCSFDAIVSGPKERGQLKFVECNGRWGGTSIPMSFMNRLFNDYRTTPYKAFDYDDERLVGHSFKTLQQIFQNDLFQTSTKQGNIILYNTGCLESNGKFDIITLGKTIKEAEELSKKLIPTRINEYFS